MNTDDRLLQILENSACLSKGQLTGYIKRTLYPEELRAVELHLSSCALCSDALEGLEMQQDVDQVIASMVPPVLPVILPKEKTEKAEAAVVLTKNNGPIHQEQHNGGQNTVQSLIPKNTWRKPVAIAAALVIGFGAIWYFTFNQDNGKELAQQTEKITDSLNHPKGHTEGTALLAKTTAENEAKVKAEAKKHTDSLTIVKREEQKRKTRRDSLMLAAAAKGDSGKNPAAATQSIAAIKSAAADEAESTEVAAKKVAAPAMAKAKEETKKELSDYELGLQKYKEKNYASALLYFKSAESDKSDPKHWDAVFYSGVCNRNLNKDRKARKMFERIVDADAPQKKAAQKQLDDMKKGD